MLISKCKLSFQKTYFAGQRERKVQKVGNVPIVAQDLVWETAHTIYDENMFSRYKSTFD